MMEQKDLRFYMNEALKGYISNPMEVGKTQPQTLAKQ
jgi:hypothetical protein